MDVKESKELRAAYCEALIDLAKKDNRIMVLDSDLVNANGTKNFKSEFSERFIDCGIAEANMVGVASGLSLTGFIPFAATFGCFAARRAYDQFFLSSNYARLNVKLVGTDPGVSAAYNGGTHMPFEDVGLMRMIPELLIAEPSDAVSVKAVVDIFYKHQGSCYLRLHRKGSPIIYENDEKFEKCKSKVIKKGKDVTILSLGAVMTQEALKAADQLKKDGIDAEVIDAIWIKPYDKKTIFESAKKTGLLVVCENCNILGGLSSAISMDAVDENLNVSIIKIGIKDQFGQVGSQGDLLKAYSLSAECIVKEIKAKLKR